jgi:aflatoxin B1 aldehyde reductase
VKSGDHLPEAIEAALLTSLKALNVVKVRTFYLHAPDRSVPFEDTVRAVNELHARGFLCVFCGMCACGVSVC